MQKRLITAALLGVLLAAQVVRTTIATAYADQQNSIAQRVTAEYPAAVTSSAMRAVGQAAAAGGAPTGQTERELRLLQRERPLAIEPLLVSAALRERRGDDAGAERLLDLVRKRDPRSAAARYLLADLKLRSGQVGPGLRELTDLSRVAPQSREEIVPALAAFANSSDAAAQLRLVFRNDPSLEDPVLALLARDANNARLILSVASRHPAASGPPAWEPGLLASMVKAGRYREAYSVWNALSGNRTAEPGLFNPSFRNSDPPPPFNWSYVSGAGGMAQPEEGALRVLYYGRQPSILASEIVLLPPGNFTLSALVSSSSGPEGALAWTVSCLPADKPLMTLPVPVRGGAKRIAGSFSVPASDCLAQRIALTGKIQDSPQTSDVRISGLQLLRNGQ